MIELRIKPRKDASLRRFHPWVFSGAVQEMKTIPADGEVVRVSSQEGDFLGIGHYQTGGSISVRILSFQDVAIDDSFWEQAISRCVSLRMQLGLVQSSDTTCYRLIHAEGDGLPGLVVDMYGTIAVMQCHSLGMYLQRHQIATAIQQVLGDKLTAVYDKSREVLPQAQDSNGYLLGEAPTLPLLVAEYGHPFGVDWEKGQKTGFFLDQRENRRILAGMVEGKTVLNTFCYTGGFSVYALKAGAKQVTSVDVSSRAMEMTSWNVAQAFGENAPHESVTADVIPYLTALEHPFDVIVLDPPAFAKNISKRHNAVQGYKRLNALAMKHINPGGLLFTFSCSQVVDTALFYNTIVAAGLESGRQISVLRHLQQPEDHPVGLYHPEGSYLKGLILKIW